MRKYILARNRRGRRRIMIRKDLQWKKSDRTGTVLACLKSGGTMDTMGFGGNVAPRLLATRFIVRTAAISMVSALAVIPLMSTHAAEIYGWVDTQGRVTYSDTPPPKDSRVIDVIHETPAGPDVLARAAERIKADELRDRVRLLELELARRERTVVDYPGPQVAPAGVGCGPDGRYDCNQEYDWSPYYTTGLLFTYPYASGRDFRGHEHRFTSVPHKNPPTRAPHLTHAGTLAHAGNGR
jgi:hypothetical protein